MLITLIPKRQDASTLGYFRLISIYTTLYKIYARILVDQLKPIISRLINLEQGAFVNSWYITDNILLAQEFMHDL